MTATFIIIRSACKLKSLWLWPKKNPRPGNVTSGRDTAHNQTAVKEYFFFSKHLHLVKDDNFCCSFWELMKVLIFFKIVMCSESSMKPISMSVICECDRCTIKCLSLLPFFLLIILLRTISIWIWNYTTFWSREWFEPYVNSRFKC